MADIYIDNNDWDEMDETPLASSPIPLSSEQQEGVHLSSYEDSKVQENMDKLSQIESVISQVEKLQERLELANSNLKKESVSTQKITKDLLEAVPPIREIGKQLKAITEAIKGQLVNVELTVSEDSYTTTKWRLEATAEAAFREGIKKCSGQANVAINDSVRLAMSGVDEKLNAFKESINADLAKYDQEIKGRKEELKNIEKKVNGMFLTDAQLYYIFVGYLLFLSAAVLGFSRSVAPGKAPVWIGVLVASAIVANLLWYALKFAWKGVRWLWGRIPGNDD